MGENRTFVFEFGEYRVDSLERRLLHNGLVVPLTPKAFETLCLLVENSSHLLEKGRLMESLWADAFVEEGNLADNISKIRQVLGDSRKDPKYIETVSGRGYRFIAEVRRIERATSETEQGRVEVEQPVEQLDLTSEPQFSEPTQEDDRSTYSAVVPVGPKKPDVQGTEAHSKTDDLAEIKKLKAENNSQNKFAGFESRWLIPVSVLGLLVLGASILFFWLESGRSTGDPVKSVAILPFKPLVADKRDEALELGVSDSLISGFSRLRHTTVSPISAVRRYAGLEQDARAAGQELGVASVLDGNIQRTGERIRVSVRLVNVEDGRTLWAETFDENFTDIFAVQDSISQRIVAALALQLSGEESASLSKKYTANTEAYHHYLKGRFFWSKLTPDGLQKSLDFYAQAIEIDPNYALAYAGLADSYNLLGSYGFWPLRESHPKARAAAEKALDIDAELAEAHASLATVIADYYWDWAAAEDHFKRAIDLNPNYPVARSWHSQHLSRMGRHDEAVEEARRAQILDPLSSSANAHVGLALFRARRFDEAQAELLKGLEFDPNALDAHIFLGFVKVQQGKGNEAIAEFQRVVELSERNPSMVALLGYGYASAGNKDKARAIIEEFNSQSKKQPVSHIETAMIHIALGDREQAFALLEKAYEERAWQLGFLQVEPIFDPIRSDPRFGQLVSRINVGP
jgi:TolB-like protein/DNA-binding winged helix-turn-helix (wHTH) protein/Flp pilus assembly protein TadD